MNLIILDLDQFDQRDFIGPVNSNLVHIGVWLKLIAYLNKAGCMMDKKIHGAVEWTKKEWLMYTGLEKQMVLNSENDSVCPDLWRKCHKTIEVYNIEEDEKTGNCVSLTWSYTNYDYRRKLANEALRSASLRKSVLAKTGGTCTYCGSDFDICVDHIVPVKAGGCNSIDNLQPLCRSCNSSKSAKMEYHSNVGMLLREQDLKQL
jgi:hypothetical protein